MFFLDSNNNRYYRGKAFTYSDIQYAPSAATEAKFLELGFTKVIPAARPDDTYYIVSGPDDSGNFTTTDRDLNALKLSFILGEKRQARRMLQNSDWLVTRLQETSEAIPADYVTYRNGVRTTNATRCNEINACSTIAELQALMAAPPLVEDPNNAGTYITNTDALTAYPAEVDEDADVATDYGL